MCLLLQKRNKKRIISSDQHNACQIPLKKVAVFPHFTVSKKFKEQHVSLPSHIHTEEKEISRVSRLRLEKKVSWMNSITNNTEHDVCKTDFYFFIFNFPSAHIMLQSVFVFFALHLAFGLEIWNLMIKFKMYSHILHRFENYARSLCRFCGIVKVRGNWSCLRGDL